MLWSVKGGRHGEYEELMLDKSVVLYDWDDFGDLRQFKTKEDLSAEYLRLFPNAPPARRGNHVGQLWAYAHDMKVGDLVVVRMKTTAAIAVAQLTGPYDFRQDLRIHHAHSATWLKTDLPPDRFAPDLLFMFGCQKTICRHAHGDAEQRVRTIAKGVSDPGIAAGEAPMPGADGAADEQPADLAEAARDAIRTNLSRRFKGHALARLVDAILKAQGYVTLPSPPGADGGVDILAGAGPMGFEAPRLVVQVKSSDAPVDSGVLRELQGIMQGHGAQQGLLVTWGGFKGNVRQEARRSFFSVRLWDQDDLINALLDNYAKFDETTRVELPLKQVWILAGEDAEGEDIA